MVTKISQLPATQTIGWVGEGIISSPAAGSIQHGAADVDTNAAIVAQTIRTQGALTGGTTNQAGKNLTLIVSPGKGTGAGGSLIIQTAPAGSTGTTVGTPTTAVTIDSTQLVTFAGNVALGSDSTTLSFGASSDTILARSGANALALRNGTNAQKFSVYNTYASAGVQEWYDLAFSGNVFFISSQSAGGGSGRDVWVQVGGTNIAAFSKNSGCLTVMPSLTIPAGGTASRGLLFSATANFGVFFGSGAPTLAAAKGSLYLRSDGSGVNDRMYVNTDGSTTWTAVVTAG